MYYNATVKNEARYFDIKANTPEEAKEIALERFNMEHHTVEIEESNIFSNAMYDIALTDEIYNVVAKCPVQNYDCLKHCPLAKICYVYWTGDED